MSMEDLVAEAKAKQAAMTPEQKAKAESLTKRFGEELTKPEKLPEPEDVTPGKSIDKSDMALMAVDELARLVGVLAKS